MSRGDLTRFGAVPQYGNRPQEGAAEANITASCKAARMLQTKHYDPVEAFEGGHYGPLQGFEKKKTIRYRVPFLPARGR